MFRVAIVGSWYGDDPKWGFHESWTAFATACRQLGEALAHDGYWIIVGSESPSTADPYVVQGYLDFLSEHPDADLRIEILSPTKERLPYQSLAKDHPAVFVRHPPETHWWRVTHLTFVQKADAVVTIGGGGSTYLVGLAAIVAGKRLLPIASFGGASQELHKELHKDIVARGRPGDADGLLNLTRAWTSEVADTAVGMLGGTRRPTVLLIHGRSEDWRVLERWLIETGVADVRVMQQEFGHGKTLPEKFESIASEIDAAIAIATPDDVGKLITDSGQKVERARQNVWLEVGWVWGRLGRERLMVLSKGSLECPSDVQGLELYTYESSPDELTGRVQEFVTSVRRIG